jgi:hypothetical protein
VRAVILIPWRPGNPDRERNLAYVVNHYERSGIAVTLGDADTLAFSRTASRNKAAQDAGAWDVAAMIDADCIIPIETLELALELAYQRNQVVLPHDHYWPLSHAGTLLAMLEPNVAKWDGSWCEDQNHRKRPSGVVVYPRRVWDEIEGYDERFTGWGFEDNAMLWALDAVSTGWLRVTGKLWHLWHPSARLTYNATDKALFERYKQARGSYSAMRALLAEREGSRMAA